ncbi:MAG: xanthine dehydrogenase family protein subunit M [Alphaproteobacteria bacterium]|nr:xanthine dehydrogenase family protein subunit M [Alphaproteobacteria bacterium]
MYAFNYHRPGSLAEATKLIAANTEAKLLAGGQTLIPTLKQRLAQPGDVIDLGGIAELKGIKVEGGSVVIGAMTRHGEVASSAEVKKAIPALAALAGGIGDPQVRNLGTIGGSIANSDPAADYPAAALGLGATIHTSKRQIPADKFFTGMFETALEEGEIIVKVAFPAPKRAAYQKFENPASRYAIVGVLVAETANGVRVAVTGAAPSVFRWTEAEAALGKSFAAGALDGLKAKADGLNADIHASAEYRAHLIGVMARRAVAACG